MDQAPISLKDYGTHPFSQLDKNTDWEYLFSNYMAMSQAFPYLQSASQKEIIFHAIEKNVPVASEAEMTSVVASFLTWDESGGHSAFLEFGYSGLSKMLDCKKYMHYHILKRDFEKLNSQFNIQPDFSPATAKYLKRLYTGLSSLDHVERISCMIAFENHAETMIKALWGSLSEAFDIPKDELEYFKLHVGGDDPAEAHHVEMTNALTSRIVKDNEQAAFRAHLDFYYRLNLDWCRSILSLQ